MEMEILPVGAYRTNCYLLHKPGDADCVLVDPGDEAAEILRILKEKQLGIAGILLTHGHFDHVGGVKALAAQSGCPVWIHEADYAMADTRFYPLHRWEYDALHFCQEGVDIFCGGLTFAVYETPGHTPGSVCYGCDGILLSGDTLFAGSCGRTDLPGGSYSQIKTSLARLKNFPPQWRVCPGHGDATELSREIQYNPYM